MPNLTQEGSNEFYLTLTQGLNRVRDYIKLCTDEDVNFHIHAMWTYKGGERPTITISNGKYGTDKIEVEGVGLKDLADEYIRRARFANSQANLQIGPPQIEGEI